MRGEDVRAVFEAALPSSVLEELVQTTDFQKRERRLMAVQLVRAAVISASTGAGERQADVLRLYFQSGAPGVGRTAAYAWFNEPFERVMAAVRERTLAFAREQKRDLPGFLGAHASDWHIVDSTTVQLRPELKAEYPGAGDYAALKVHKRFSVGYGTLYDYHLSPAREHDAPHLKIDESWRGLGLIVDLGYASHGLLRDCQTHGVKLVLRLKETWKAKVQSVNQGELLRGFVTGTDLDVLIGEGTLKLRDKPVDLEVTVGRGERAIPCRVVGIPGPRGWSWLLTNLPRSVTPAQVKDLYRIRWEIESDNKLDKDCFRLDEISATTGISVRAMVDAAMVGATLICLVAHTHRLRDRPPRKGAERTRSPIHPQMMAKMVAFAAMRIAAAFDLTGKAAVKEWDFLAGLLHHQGIDPNWRRRPSVLDQLRGWRITPGAPAKAKAASLQESDA